MSWAVRVLAIDRRLIFVLVGLGTALPLLWPVNLPITVTPRVEAAYQPIESLPPGSTVFISMDYEPDTMAELQPMSIAVLRHCFRKNLKLIVITLYPAGPGLVEPALRLAAVAEGKERNKDYAFLGYKSGFQTVMIAIGESIRQQFPVDFYGTPLDSIPVMRGVDSYAKIDLVINLSASSGADYWIQFAASRFHKPLFVGVAAGYLLAIQYQDVILPNVWTPLTAGPRTPQSIILALIPAILGILMLARVWERMTGPARWAIAFYVGIYSGIAVPGYLQGQIFAQLSDAAKPFAPGWVAVNSALVLLGLLTVLAYFFFSAPH